MARAYVPEDDKMEHADRAEEEGSGVVRVNTKSMTLPRMAPPKPLASDYLSDGRGMSG